MKIAFVKQLLDVFGPWGTVMWDETSPLDLFDLWPGKAVLWQMTVLQRADWYVVPQQINTEFTFDSVLSRSGQSDIIRRYTRNVTEPKDIPYDDYDIVITLDPVLRPPKNVNTVFAYYMNEHWDVLYYRSLHQVMKGYDLFLAHMLDAPWDIDGLPQAISFPYMWELNTTRVLFPVSKEPVAWVDWRTLDLLSGAGKGSENAVEKTVLRLQEYLGMPIRYREFKKSLYRPADPPPWGDAKGYFADIASCKYYIGVGRASGGGQGLVDAVSLGAIAFGEQDKPFHRLVCHPACLCSDMAELPRRFKTIESSSVLQDEVIAWQDQAICRHFIERPLTVLEKVSDIKRKSRKV